MRKELKYNPLDLQGLEISNAVVNTFPTKTDAQNYFTLKSFGVEQKGMQVIFLDTLKTAKWDGTQFIDGLSATKTSELINDGSDETSTYVEADELGAVAFSNDYNDLDNKPTIPTVITNHSGLSLDDGTNPHGTTNQDVGLGNVPNLDTTNAVNNEHTHSNKIILDNTTESFITALKNAYDGAVSWVTTNGTNLLNHLSNNSNPHNVTKYQVGLGNADNTSDANKPISTATQTALDTKLDKGGYTGTAQDLKDELLQDRFNESIINAIIFG